MKRVLMTTAILVAALLCGCTAPSPQNLQFVDEATSVTSEKTLPTWWNAEPHEKDGRLYCAGISGQASSTADGLRQAEADAHNQIAQMVSTQIVSQTRSELSRLKHDGRPEYRDVFSETSRSLSDEALRGVRREAHHAEAGAGGKCQVRALVSVPVSEIRPTPKRRMEQLAELAAAKMKRGDLAGASNCWQTLYLFEPGSEKYALNAASCLDALGLWQDAVDVLARFCVRNPQHPARAKINAEITRLETRIGQDLGKVQWADTIGRMRELMAQNAGGQIRITTDHKIYPMFDAAGKRHEIILTVRTKGAAYLNLIWLDAEGVFMMDDYAEGQIPVKTWNDKIRLRTGTKPGDVTLFAVASPRRLTIPVRKVMKAEVAKRDPAALTSLQALERSLRKAIVAGKLPTDHVDIKIMP